MHPWPKGWISILETGQTPLQSNPPPLLTAWRQVETFFRATIGPEAFRGMVVWEIPVEDPGAVAQRLAAFLGEGFNTDRAAAAVDRACGTNERELDNWDTLKCKCFH